MLESPKSENIRKLFHIIKQKVSRICSYQIAQYHQSLLAIICAINNYLFSIIFKTYIVTSGDKNEYDMVPLRFKNKKDVIS